MFAGTRNPGVTAIACTLPNLKRIRLLGNRCDLTDLIAGSSSIPGAVPPHRIGRTLLVDGGVRSNTSVDLGPEANHLTVIVPVGATLLGRSPEPARSGRSGIAASISRPDSGIQSQPPASGSNRH